MPIDTQQLPWTPSHLPGVELKSLSEASEELPHSTWLVRMAAGASWPAPPEGHGLEVFVLEGECVTEKGALKAQGYWRSAAFGGEREGSLGQNPEGAPLPPTHPEQSAPAPGSSASHPASPKSSSASLAPQQPISTSTGCTLFLKIAPRGRGDTLAVQHQTDTLHWLPGQGNLRVKPLQMAGAESTALVHWPANERFQPHRHMGGEKILVLSGTFCDEHGTYPKLTWLCSPHGSQHFPFVEEETLILVKTGHMPPR